ncbi:uncharacterized protein LOC129350994 isoform X2 [Amphiprion ocellaris]|uniref:uncharacterized protein LOC129350994 isoform X2 n=1 Tax=Amphiprion ocellaris TaxID=80972 RepID=UPI002410EDB2|nr:uncharacterized protein LOC129350994 isoform X2 [Amphiprion ocellaris]
MKRSRLFCLWWWTKEYRESWTEKVYQEVSERMAAHIYSRLYIKRTMKQCREKLKKFKNDYRFTKDHSGRRGSTRRCWKRFNGSYLLAPHQRATGGRLSCCIIGDVQGRIPFDVRSLLHLRHGAPSSLPPLQHQLQHQYQLGHRACHHQLPAHNSNVLSPARGKGATENWTFQACLWRCRLRRNGVMPSMMRTSGCSSARQERMKRPCSRGDGPEYCLQPVIPGCAGAAGPGSAGCAGAAGAGSGQPARIALKKTIVVRGPKNRSITRRITSNFCMTRPASVHPVHLCPPPPHLVPLQADVLLLQTKELQTLHNLLKLLVQDLTTRVKKVTL